METSTKYVAIAYRHDLIVARGFGSSRRVAMQRLGADLYEYACGLGQSVLDQIAIKIERCG